MKIAILGAGALGSVFGARLTQSGNQVVMIDPNQEIVDIICQKGVTIIKKDCEPAVVQVHAVTSPEQAVPLLGAADLILVLVKGMYTRDAVRNAACLIDEHTRFLTVQNGIGNPEVIAEEYGNSKVYYGTTVVGAQVPKLGSVKDLTPPSGHTTITSMNGAEQERLETIAQTLTRAGLATEVSSTASQMVWRKLAMNCVANAPGVITRMTNGHYIGDPNGLEIAKMIVHEVCAVANAKGIALDEMELIPWIVETMSPQVEMFSSMTQDAIRKRPLELDTITGGVVREGERLGIPTPVNRAIYYFDRLISNNYDKQYQ